VDECIPELECVGNIMRRRTNSNCVGGQSCRAPLITLSARLTETSRALSAGMNVLNVLTVFESASPSVSAI
jgi:hypothetical protein